MIEFRTVCGSDARSIDGSLDWPDDAWVVFAIEDGEIVARSSILPMPLVEATFVKQEKRNGTLAFRLFKEVEKLYLEHGKPVAMAMALDSQPDIKEYLTRMGFEEMPLTLFIKNLISLESEKAA